MKHLTFMTLIALTALLVSCGGSKQEASSDSEAEAATETATGSPLEAYDSLEEKVSYLLGHSNIGQLRAQGADVKIEAYIAGVKAAGEGGEPGFTQDELQAVFSEYQEKLQSKAQEEFDATASANQAKSAEFLTANAEKEGVVTTPSGLQYKVLDEGQGDKPASAETTVKVHYEGRLISGDVFDSSIARGEPVEFALNQVISGWTEGLQLMPEGSRWELYIPSDLAYGPSGSRSIGPNEALIFVVELLEANVEQ